MSLPTEVIATRRSRRRYRTLNAGMALGAVQMYHYARAHGWAEGTTFPGLHLPTVTSSKSREEFKLRWWGLAVQVQGRDAAGHGSLLALTPSGVLFVKGELRVAKQAVMRLDWLTVAGEDYRAPERFTELTGELVSIDDVLPFDQRELLGVAA